MYIQKYSVCDILLYTADAELNESGTDNGEKIISLLQSFVVEVYDPCPICVCTLM